MPVFALKNSRSQNFPSQIFNIKILAVYFLRQKFQISEIFNINFLAQIIKLINILQKIPTKNPIPKPSATQFPHSFCIICQIIERKNQKSFMARIVFIFAYHCLRPLRVS
jgi:hypothetical protein